MKKEPIIKGVAIHFTKAYFGHCLYEKHKNYHTQTGHENVDIYPMKHETIHIHYGVDDWNYCPICKIKWHIGSGIFSVPDEDFLGCTKEEYFSDNALKLRDYEDFTDKVIEHPDNEKAYNKWLKSIEHLNPNKKRKDIE